MGGGRRRREGGGGEGGGGGRGGGKLGGGGGGGHRIFHCAGVEGRRRLPLAPLALSGSEFWSGSFSSGLALCAGLDLLALWCSACRVERLTVIGQSQTSERDATRCSTGKNSGKETIHIHLTLEMTGSSAGPTASGMVFLEVIRWLRRRVCSAGLGPPPARRGPRALRGPGSGWGVFWPCSKRRGGWFVAAARFPLKF